MNKLVKWIGLIVVIGAFPILCRIAIFYFPKVDQSNFSCFSLTDLLFYGITLHINIIYELLNFKKDSTWNTVAIWTSVVLLLLYIIYSILGMILKTEVESFGVILFLIPISIIFSVVCYYLGMPKDEVQNG